MSLIEAGSCLIPLDYIVGLHPEIGKTNLGDTVHIYANLSHT
jgi:hypothetical protein